MSRIDKIAFLSYPIHACMTPKQKLLLQKTLIPLVISGLIVVSIPQAIAQVFDPSTGQIKGNDPSQSTSGCTADPAICAQINAQIADNQQRLDDLRAQEDQYQQQVESAQSQVNTYQSQLSALGNQIALANIGIQKTQVQIDALNLEMQSLQLSIDKKNADIASNRKMLIDAIQQLDSNTRVSTLALVMQYNNFGEFFSQAQAQAQISQSLNDAISTISLAKADLENKQSELGKAQDDVKSQKAQLETQKTSVEVQADYQQELLNKSKHSAAQYEQLLNDKINEEAEVNSSIVNLKGRLQAILTGNDANQADQPSPQGYVWPVPSSARNSHLITCGFHCTGYPWGTHYGLDLGVSPWTPVYAVADGTIMLCGTGTGNYIPDDGVCKQPSTRELSMIGVQHGGKIMSEYLHLIQFAPGLKIGTFVSRGQFIGYSGGAVGSIGAGTQTSGGGHLHLEMHAGADLQNGNKGYPVDPLIYLPY